MILNIESESFDQGAVRVPISAIVADETNDNKYVFVFDNQTQQIERREITEVELIGKDDVVVTKGLKAGDRVVCAGATRLVNGQQVKVLTD